MIETGLRCCKWCCVILFAAFLIIPHFNDGFKLDITSPQRNDEDKTPKNTPTRDLPPFKKIVKIIRVEDKDSDDELNIKFEKVHKADFSKPRKVIEKIEEKQHDDEAKELSEESSWSLIGVMELLGLFGEKSEPESNGIIDWLKTFKMKEDSKPKEVRSEQETLFETLMSYLDRWPFNLFIPFEKAQKLEKSKTRTDTGGPEEQQPEPLTQENFELLLHKLPHFIPNASYVQDIECKKQLLIMQRQLRGHKLWTLQMLDASAKVPSGMLRGNLNQFGDFDLCTHIKTVVKVTPDQPVRIKGKYCLAHIEVELKNEELKVPLYMAHGRGLWNSRLENPSHFVPRYTTVNWGVCVPDSCSADTVHEMLDATLKPYNYTGLNFHIDVSEDDCYIRKKVRPVNLLGSNWHIAFTVFIFALFTTTVVIASIIDNWGNLKVFLQKYLKKLFSSANDQAMLPSDENGDEQEVMQESEMHLPSLLKQLVLSFSVNRTLSDLLSFKEDEITILPALRAICTFFLYLCLKFTMIGHLPITNRDKLVKTLDNPLSITFRSPLIYLDSLLLISGLLSALHMNEEIKQKSSIRVLKRFAGKFLRFLPTLYVVLLFQTWILPHLSSGPLWGTLIGRNAKLCEENMWRNIFATQNIINFEETCSPMTILLAIQLQLYLLTPFLIWLYNSNEDIGFLVYGALHAVSVATRFAKTNLDRLSPTLFHGMNVSKFYRTANIYSSPLQRATAYLVGVGVAVLLQSEPKSIQVPKVATIIGWTTAFLSIVWCFWYPSHNMSTEFVYNPAEAAIYASWAPLLLSLALGWIIFWTSTEELPFGLGRILSCKLVILFSRISYPLQLIAYTVVLFSTAETKEPGRFHISDLISLKEILVIICITLYLAIIVDIPFKSIRKILLLYTSKPLSDIAEEEVVEVEDEEDHSEHIIEDKRQENAPENEREENLIEDIWDSNEREELTFTRRRSDFEKLNWNPDVEWDKIESVDENWRTESDIDQHNAGTPEKDAESYDFEEGSEGGEEEEEEEEMEITEEEEVVRRPESPVPMYLRRRWNVDDD